MTRMLTVIAAAAVAAAIGCAPRSDDRTVSEPPAAALPTPAELATMPDAQRGALRTKLMNEAAARPDTTADEPMDMAGGPVLSAGGEFSGVDERRTGSGNVKIYQLPDSSYVVRLENFRVTNGPALIVALAVHPDPRSDADVYKGFISIGELKANTGNQNYEVPAEFDVFSFGSVVIWCELFGVTFASAPLKLY